METSANERGQATGTATDFLSTDQVVELLGLSAPTVRKLVKQGHLPAHRPPGGRKLLFLRRELHAAVSTWSQAHPVPGGRPPNASPVVTAPAPADALDPEHGLDHAAPLVLTIDADGEERWEPLDSLSPEVQAW